ncbi:hypothetical protein [Pedobacter antarcticus]|uniref:hypothetical protein n=1 Tax=Pedobacter antarcticus TaxID=34086 RepID=UPI00292EDD9C|nr:hypothetical protein [Pedobacter antarcticus]
MATIKARGQITIIDQNDAVSFQAFIGSNLPLSQIYTKDTNSYLPDWTTAPYLILTPQLFISGVPGDSISAAGKIKPGSAKWRKDGTLLTNGGSYVITPAAPFTLTVKSNENVAGGTVKYQFSAILVDPNNGLETDFSTVISFQTLQNSSAGLIAVVSAPDGVVFKNDKVNALRVHADLYRGNQVDNTLVNYKWGIQNGGVFAPTTAGSAAVSGAATVVLARIDNVIVGSKIKIGATTYTATTVNTTSKSIGVTPNLTAAVASGAAVTSPYYDAELGVNWALISADPFFNGITGFATNEITVPNGAVLNFESFKCLIKDVDPNSGTTNQTAFDILSLTDFSDPISIDIAAPAGTIIKNGSGSIALTAKVWQAGVEIDTGGTLYGYQWVRYDANGVIDSGFNQTTKSINVTSAQVNGKSTFEVRLMSLT